MAGQNGMQDAFNMIVHFTEIIENYSIVMHKSSGYGNGWHPSFSRWVPNWTYSYISYNNRWLVQRLQWYIAMADILFQADATFFILRK